MKNNIPTVEAVVSKKLIPVLIATSICPHCKNFDWDFVENAAKGQTLLNSCANCDGDYYVSIPEFKNLKTSKYVKNN